MAVFSERHGGYKVGVVLFFISIIVFIVGFASPHWSSATVTADSISASVHFGLWLDCGNANGRSVCVSFAGHESTFDSAGGSWTLFQAVQALQCLALIGYFLAGFYAVYANCCSSSRVTSRGLEVVVAVSSMLAITGIIIYAVYVDPNDDSFLSIFDDVHITLVEWAFALDIAGSVLAFIAAILISVFNRPLAGELASPGTVFAVGYDNPMTGVAYVTPQAAAAAPGVITNAANPPMSYVGNQPMVAGGGVYPPPYNTIQ